MDFVTDLVIPAAAGLVGGFLGAALNLVWRVKLPVVLPVVLGHRHDWHVRGKLHGAVREYCTGCPAERTRAS